MLGSTKIYGCLADPIEHVKAPTIFTSIFNKKKIDAVMIPIHVSKDNLSEVISSLKLIKNFHGLTITIPHKTDIVTYCDFLEPDADKTKAVNWIKFDENRKLIGNNFDGKGFVNGFLEQKYSLTNKSVCLFGTGGAGVAIAYALANENLKKLTFINRDINKANNLKGNINKIYSNLHIQVLSHLNYELDDFDLVINATSLGLKNNDKLPFDVNKTRLDCIIADIIMNPSDTELLKQAKYMGRTIHYGKYMIESQIELVGNFLNIW
jgi:shikimate dehydrogenase